MGAEPRCLPPLPGSPRLPTAVLGGSQRLPGLAVSLATPPGIAPLGVLGACHPPAGLAVLAVAPSRPPRRASTRLLEGRFVWDTPDLPRHRVPAARVRVNTTVTAWPRGCPRPDAQLPRYAPSRAKGDRADGTRALETGHRPGPSGRPSTLTGVSVRGAGARADGHGGRRGGKTPPRRRRKGHEPRGAGDPQELDEARKGADSALEPPAGTQL